MPKTAILFAGQGAQSVGMGKDVAMAQVDGIGPTEGPRRVLGESLRRMAKAARPADQPPVDKVEISQAARDIAAVSGIPGIRHKLVQSVRAQIAAGTYMTEEKWEVAVERMLRDLAWGRHSDGGTR